MAKKIFFFEPIRAIFVAATDVAEANEILLRHYKEEGFELKEAKDFLLAKEVKEDAKC